MTHTPLDATPRGVFESQLSATRGGGSILHEPCGEYFIYVPIQNPLLYVKIFDIFKNPMRKSFSLKESQVSIQSLSVFLKLHPDHSEVCNYVDVYLWDM